MGVERVVRDTGYALRVVNTAEGDPPGVAGAVDSLLDQGVDGIVISEPIDEQADDEAPFLRLDVPVLFIEAPPSVTAPTVLTTGQGADLMARTATEHLLDLGHMTVHHLAGPQRWYAARDHLEGWRAALTAQDRDVPPVVAGDRSAASGHRAGREPAEDGGVTAVYAANDDMAIGIRALTEAGRRVPDDVSVVGFDDIPVAAHVAPPLTTVRQPFDAVAQEGLKRLVHAIEYPKAEPLPPSGPRVDLVVRASTAPPPPSWKTPARGRRTASRATRTSRPPLANGGPSTHR